MEKTLQVYLPYPKSTITQRFGENANPLYAGQGLKGHTAYDWGVPYGTNIPNCTPNAYCYSIMHQNDPTLMDYRAAFFIVETQTGVYEVSYGHMSTILAVPGQTYQVGELIGLVGNTGPVFIGQHEVTEAEKDAGSHAGAHLHGPQIRPVTKVVTPTKNTEWYLQTSNGYYRDKDGYDYETMNYDNGYNGCENLANWSTETLTTDYKAPVVDNLVVASTAITAATKIVAEVPTMPKDQQSETLNLVKKLLLYIANLLKLG